ncbi:MAG TPA: methylmalonyl-CoA mutase family protein [Candidatus Limnocylindrales bacterium]|nr:methylmalonyl-CoA mutase family protein [Candidatus Limnocylindrales bacterium]
MALRRSRTAREEWEEHYRSGKQAARDGAETISGLPIQPLYTPADLEGFDYERKLGYPGHFPYTRGVYHSMYRGRPWTIRQFAGYGSARETNARYKFLLAQGQAGLSVAFDMPTLMGYDSDDPLSRGEVGHCGVAIDSLEDMEVLLSGIRLDAITTSMTINSPAAILWAMYIAVAERGGVPLDRLGGTLQNDILKEYIAQKEYIFPPEPSMRLVVDTIVFAARQAPRWNPVSISGYHIREAGSTAVQELAFTLADGMAYVEAAVRAGLQVDEFAPRLSFFFDSHIDFFEEIAKFRAARRLWASIMRDRYGARDPRSGMLRFHTQTAGVSLTRQQVENNVSRTAVEALAAVLGGTNSLHTNAMDEVLALPTERAAQIALRTQQILAYETGVTNTIDPLGGSYFIERLTDEMEAGARQYFERIDAEGGVLAAIEKGFFQREIADAAFAFERKLEANERIVVGVNAFMEGESAPVPTLRIGPETEEAQVRSLKALRARRDNTSVHNRLEDLKAVARGRDNLMPPLIACVKAYATEGEIMTALKDVFGVYREQSLF